MKSFEGTYIPLNTTDAVKEKTEIVSTVSREQTEAGNDLNSQLENSNGVEDASRSTYAGRLIEYITGVKLNDPNLPERLINDQKIIRAKYNLPPREMRFDSPGEFEKILHNIAHTHNIRIDSKSECGTFFTESPGAGGVFFENSKKIGVDIDRGDYDAYTHSIGVFEHELIHGLQNEYSPGMPIELLEYEAYIAGAGLNHLKDMDETERIESLEVFIGYAIGYSVQHWYSHHGEEIKKEQRPVWDDPDYFNTTK